MRCSSAATCRDGLPSPTAERFIKLHGNRQGLRADYTLEAAPSEADRRCFLEYLRAQRHDVETSIATDLDFRNHLLVIGHSLSERRTRGLIEHAWRHLNDQFRVFWLCHSSKDVDRVRLFTQAAGRSKNSSVILRYPDPGLFLLHLYQRLRRNLPAHAELFPSPSRLPFPPLDSAHGPVHAQLMRKSTDTQQFQESLLDQLREFRDRKYRFCRFVVATSGPDVHGVTTACADIFRRLEDDKDLPTTCLWLDMNDISSADNLFETLLEAAYFQLRLEHWTPSYIASDPERPRTKEIERLVTSSNNPWVIFLNARETPGANTTNPNAPAASAHGWLDGECSEVGSDDRSGCIAAFLSLIDELCKQGHGISVVLLCRELDAGSPLGRGLPAHGIG